MNVLVLEHPRIPSAEHFNDIANTPLWSSLLSGYVAASIQQAGCRVELLDAFKEEWDFEQTARNILRNRPDLLCVHGVYFWEHTGVLFDFLNSLRSNGFIGHINLFGFFASLTFRELLKQVPAVDSIAVGECEHTLTGLAIRLEAKLSWNDIPGIAIRSDRDGKAVLEKRRIPESNPDLFPFPLRRMEKGQTAGVLASRGCYNHCCFCPIPGFYNQGPLWRGRIPEEIAKEIAFLKQNGMTDIYFMDPNFVGPGGKGKKRIRHLCRLLKPLAVSFGMETRANDLDPELLSDLTSAGLKSLLIGIESGSMKVLGKLQKHGSIAASEAAIAICRSAGIEPEIGFLMFVQDSGLEDISENFAFLKRNRLLDRLDRTANLLSHRQIVLMGTSGFNMFKSQGRIAATGLLGYQAEVSWTDPKVLWMADVIGHACRRVLKKTGDPDSPLYFRKHTDWHTCRELNDYLVDLFERCLKIMFSSRNGLFDSKRLFQAVHGELEDLGV